MSPRTDPHSSPPQLIRTQLVHNFFSSSARTTEIPSRRYNLFTFFSPRSRVCSAATSSRVEDRTNPSRRKGVTGSMRKNWMTRNVRTAFGLAATVCACAVVATPALAEEASFLASKTGATKGTSLTRNEQETFKFHPFSVTCLKGKSTGSVVAGTNETIKTTVTYTNCKTFAIVPVTVTPAEIEYHANGTVSIGSTIEVKSQDLKCSITIPPQTTAKNTATYSNETVETFTKKGTIFIHALGLAGSMQEINYKASGWPCGTGEIGEETEGTEGKFSQELRDELIGGSLEFKPAGP